MAVRVDGVDAAALTDATRVMNRLAITATAIVVAVISSAGLSYWVRTSRHGSTRSRTAHTSRRPAGRTSVPLRPLDAPPSPEPPRSYRMDRFHTGRSGYLLPRHPRILRRIESGGRISAQAVLGRDGRLIFGSHDGTVYAADPSTGTIAWRLGTGDRIYASALVGADGKIFVGTDADRFLAITGAGSLSVALATEDDADTSAQQAPDGSLRFAAGRTLYAVDPDLTVRWRLAFGAKVFSSPAVLDDGTSIVGCQDDSIYAVDAAGAVRWRVATQGDVDAPAAIDASGGVYVGSDDGSLYAVAAADGAVRWRRPLGGYIRAGVALGLDGTLVVGTYGPRPRIVGVDRATGDLRWSVAVAGPPSRDYGVASAALVDRTGRFAVGTPDDALLVIGPDGTIESRVSLPADVDSPPVLVADRVLAVGCDDGSVYVLGE